MGSAINYLKKMDIGAKKMDIGKYLKQSLKRAIKTAGNMKKLAENRSMDYSTINRFNSGSNAIENMPVKTLIKLFPELRIYCFTDDLPAEPYSPGIQDSDILGELAATVHRLSPKEKLRLLSMVARNFGEKTTGM